ncbi:hypothetical protein SY83_20730 [Paenibacillus swuensis]|uniref:Lipopolysaccharide assembly protein A domain-containing protein n=1 Tax=Paenibacillus swuensis TaxID=1178515 RepID=A0A172TQ21_9BACL|nr:lipopolysaccharide assembly protein LapA domain-containing protein [Paenibacillus swuensis]ANE49082.1 hypothetical protein SY83_20730 [Paenibacillus swuensis]
MKTQWMLISVLIFALIIALFAVLNVDPVLINYAFGEAQVPLILVILGSALLGGLTVGLFGIVRQYKLQRRIRTLSADLAKVNSSAPVPQGMTPVPSADATIADKASDSKINHP